MLSTRPFFRSFFLRALAVAALFLAAPLAAVSPARAATPAESFVQDNITKGLAILNDKQLSHDQRREQFEKFLFGLTDMKSLAMSSLSQYRRGASQADLDAFALAFQNYCSALFQSYFDSYTSQKLTVVSSQEFAPDDIRVTARMTDPSGKPPVDIVFYLSNSNGKMVVTDASASGARLLLTKKAEFASVLGNNDGKIPVLIQQLDKITTNIKSGLR